SVTCGRGRTAPSICSTRATGASCASNRRASRTGVSAQPFAEPCGNLPAAAFLGGFGVAAVLLAVHCQQMLQRALEMAVLWQRGAEIQHMVAALDHDGREAFDVECVRPVGGVLDVDPVEGCAVMPGSELF